MANDCPYEPDAILELHRGNDVLSVRILKVFSGGGEEVFSNSCALHVLNLENNQNRVLKIMDWRYAANPRESYECGPWTQSQAQLYEAFPQQEMVDFQQWLEQPISPSHCSHTLIQKLQAMGRLHPNSIYMDLYQYILLLPTRYIEEYVQAGLIHKQPTTAHREIFLRQSHKYDVASELQIAQMISTELPGCMPQEFGVWDVRVPNTGSANMPLPYYQVWGILMEHIVGQPLCTIDSLLFTPEKLKYLLLEIACFQLRLWRHGLQFVDTNLHNFIVRFGQGSHVSLTPVDFGAITMISEEPIIIKCGLFGERMQFPMQYFAHNFDPTIEILLLSVTANRISSADPSFSEFAESLMPSCFDCDFDVNIDRCMWQTMMLHLLYSYNEKVFIHDTRSVLSSLLQARDIMAEEFLTRLTGNEWWWDRAAQRIAQFIGVDSESTKTRVKEAFAGFISHEQDDIPQPPDYSSRTLQVASLNHHKQISKQNKIFGQNSGSLSTVVLDQVLSRFNPSEFQRCRNQPSTSSSSSQLKISNSALRRLFATSDIESGPETE